MSQVNSFQKFNKSALSHPNTTLSGSSNILVVEDEALVALSIEIELAEMDYQPIGPAVSIAEAKRFLDKYTVDGAILDVTLKDGEVFPFADLLAERNIPFVFHSGNQDTKALEDRYKLPAFTKPTHPRVLVEKIGSLVKERD